MVDFIKLRQHLQGYATKGSSPHRQSTQKGTSAPLLSCAIHHDAMTFHGSLQVQEGHCLWSTGHERLHRRKGK